MCVPLQKQQKYLHKNTTTPKMLKSIFIVGIGSFIGGAIRYIISTLMKTSCNTFLPWGTLAVNLIGCFIIGALYALFSKHTSTSNSLFLLLTTGFCEGFTTFSTFATKAYKCSKTAISADSSPTSSSASSQASPSSPSAIG